MTEEEAKQRLFQIHYEYMQHSKEERLELYEEYKNKRKQIRDALIKGRQKDTD